MYDCRTEPALRLLIAEALVLQSAQRSAGANLKIAQKNKVEVLEIRGRERERESTSTERCFSSYTLILKCLSIDWSVGAKIPPITFIAPAGLPPVESHAR